MSRFQSREEKSRQSLMIETEVESLGRTRWLESAEESREGTGESFTERSPRSLQLERSLCKAMKTQWSQNCCCSVVQSYLTLCKPMDCSMPGLPVHHKLPEFTQTHVCWVSDVIQPSQSFPSPPPSIFPSIRVFFNELVLHIRWPKYWSFSFNISPFNEH